MRHHYICFFSMVNSRYRIPRAKEISVRHCKWYCFLMLLYNLICANGSSTIFFLFHGADYRRNGTAVPWRWRKRTAGIWGETEAGLTESSAVNSECACSCIFPVGFSSLRRAWARGSHVKFIQMLLISPLPCPSCCLSLPYALLFYLSIAG